MTTFDFINEPFTFFTGLVITGAAVIGVLYKGMRWLRDEVKKENVRIRDEVKEENAEIKQQTIERVEQNKQEVKTVADNITKELKYTKEIIGNKLDTISDVTKENRIALDNYQKDIGKTVTRTHDKVNEHDSRISVLETHLRNIFSKQPVSNAYYDRQQNLKKLQDDNNNSHE